MQRTEYIEPALTQYVTIKAQSNSSRDLDGTWQNHSDILHAGKKKSVRYIKKFLSPSVHTDSYTATNAAVPLAIFYHVRVGIENNFVRYYYYSKGEIITMIVLTTERGQ